MAFNSQRHLHICYANTLCITTPKKTNTQLSNKFPLQKSLDTTCIHIKRLTALAQFHLSNYPIILVMAFNSSRHLHICLANTLCMTTQTKNTYSAINQISTPKIIRHHLHTYQTPHSFSSISSLQLSHHSCHGFNSPRNLHIC